MSTRRGRFPRFRSLRIQDAARLQLADRFAVAMVTISDAGPLAEASGQYVQEWCAQVEACRSANVMQALLRSLGQLFIDCNASEALASITSDVPTATVQEQRPAPPPPPLADGAEPLLKAFRTTVNARPPTAEHSEQRNQAQQRLQLLERRLSDAIPLAMAADNSGHGGSSEAVLQVALQLSGSFTLLADCLLTGAERTVPDAQHHLAITTCRTRQCDELPWPNTFAAAVSQSPYLALRRLTHVDCTWQWWWAIGWPAFLRRALWSMRSFFRRLPLPCLSRLSRKSFMQLMCCLLA